MKQFGKMKMSGKMPPGKKKVARKGGTKKPRPKKNLVDFKNKFAKGSHDERANMVEDVLGDDSI